MSKLTDILLTTAILLGFVIVIFSVVTNRTATIPRDLSLGGVSDPSCTVSSATSTAIGNEASSQILAAKGNRAYARVSVIGSESNIVSLSFDEGASALVNKGIVINGTTTEGTATYVEFGRATNFPYVGAVTGITNTSSTTIAVTECLY